MYNGYMTISQKNRLINILGIIGILLTCYATWWAYHLGILTSQQKMEEFIAPFGLWGILFFIFIQIIQTVIPIIPGSVTIIAGAAMYGLTLGTLYNYIGIVIGCAILYWVVQRFGTPFVMSVVGEKKYLKTMERVKRSKNFTKLFIITMLLPFMPADLICCFAALSDMEFKKYMTIILLTKPIAILTYTIGFSKLIQWFYLLIK